MNTNDQAKIAQCPHCQSTFLASQKEMRLALGAVRCGECMKIFNANYHFVSENNTAIHQAALSTLANDLPSDQEEQDNIPTLHDHPEQLTDPDSNHYNSLETPAATHLSNEELDPLFTEQEPFYYEDYAADPELSQTEQVKKFNIKIASGLVVLVMALLLGGKLIMNKTPKVNYEFTEIRLVPSASDKTLTVHFNLKNISTQTLPLPDLTIDLLNLSSQAVSSNLISATDLDPNLIQIQAANSHPITVTLQLPSTFVQTARIQPYFNDPKL